jgi:Mg2+/citrate symporter
VSVVLNILIIGCVLAVIVALVVAKYNRKDVQRIESQAMESTQTQTHHQTADNH